MAGIKPARQLPSPPHLPLPGRVRPGEGGGQGGRPRRLAAAGARSPRAGAVGCRRGWGGIPLALVRLRWQCGLGRTRPRESGGWRVFGCASLPPDASPLIHRKRILFAAGTWGSVRGSGVRWFLPLLFFFGVTSLSLGSVTSRGFLTPRRRLPECLHSRN